MHRINARKEGEPRDEANTFQTGYDDRCSAGVC